MDYPNLPNVRKLLQSYPRRANANRTEIERMQIDILTDLDAHEFEVLEGCLIRQLNSGDPHQYDMVAEIMVDIQAYTSQNRDRVLLAALDTQQFLPAQWFRGAGDTVKSKLISLVRHNPELAKRGLAWIGDEEAVAWFVEKKNKSRNQNSINGDHNLYPHDAGWELTPDNEKRPLFSLHCFEMTPVHWNPLSPQFKQHENPELCEVCNTRIIRVKSLRASLLKDLFAISPLVETVDFPFCELCTMLTEPLRAIVSIDGTAKICKPILKPEDIADWFSEKRGEGGCITIDIGARRDPFFAVDYCSRDNVSQIGGHPTWVQDSEYPICNSCGRTMLFFMQIDGNQLYCIFPFVYYFFICDLCPEQIAVSNQHT